MSLTTKYRPIFKINSQCSGYFNLRHRKFIESPDSKVIYFGKKVISGRREMAYIFTKGIWSQRLKV